MKPLLWHCSTVKKVKKKIEEQENDEESVDTF